MTLVRWEPVRELNSLQQEMNRLFNGFFDSPRTAARPGAATRWLPAMDLAETEQALVLHADLPGLTESDVAIEFDNNTLTISGERTTAREDDGADYHRVERASGRFVRSLTLPEGIDPDAITATFNRGVLEVTIPKPAQRSPQRVPIAVSEAPQVVEGTAEPTAAEPVAA